MNQSHSARDIFFYHTMLFSKLGRFICAPPLKVVEEGVD